MLKHGAVVVLLIAGLAILDPVRAPWLYVAGCFSFEIWLSRRIRALGSDPVEPGTAPYEFSVAEARLVGRYRFYFTFPAVARESGSILAAVGLSALLLTPWLTWKQAYAPAILIGANLFIVARFTKQVAPLNALRLAGSRGSRDALEMLEAHDSAWKKILAANAAESAAG